MAQLILPPLSIVAAVRNGSTTVNTTYSNPLSTWNGSAFKYNTILDLIVQTNSSEDTTPTAYQYSGLDVQVGMWIGLTNGYIYKITSIASATETQVNCVIEDADLYNLLIDNTQQGDNFPPESQNGLIFTISDDGIPIIVPTALIRSAIGDSTQWLNDLHDRFRFRNYLTDFFAINPDSTSYTGFVEGDFVKINSSGVFIKVTTNNQSDILSIAGIVTSVDIPSTGNIRVRPVGKITSNLPTLPGDVGAVLYFDPTQPNNLSATAPSTGIVLPVYIKIDNTTAILLPKAISSAGTSGTSGATGTSGINGVSGTSGINGINGSNGISGTSGISGFNGSAGTSGSSDGTSGTSGNSGTSGINGSSGTSGSHGTAGTSGSSGTSGTSGTSGSSNGTAGTSGSSGSSGTAGTSGSSGSAGTSGTAGTAGVTFKGTSGSIIQLNPAGYFLTVIQEDAILPGYTLYQGNNIIPYESSYTLTANTTYPIDTQSGPKTLSSSSDGRYIVTSGTNTGIYSSADSGVNWVYNDIYSSITYISVASSYSGQYSVALSGTTIDGYKRILRSSNFGGSWVEDGQIDVVPDGDKGNPNFIKISGDGSKWLSATGNLSQTCGGGYIIVGNALQFRPDNYRQWADGAVSYYGQYMLVVGRVCNTPYQIAYAVSSNYGIPNWVLSVINLVGYSSQAYLAAMSGDGKYMWFIISKTPSAGGTTTYNMYISTNNGISFSQRPNPIPDEGAIQSISISNDGKIWFISSGINIYYSPDYGVSWFLFYTYGGGGAYRYWISLSV